MLQEKEKGLLKPDQTPATPARVTPDEEVDLQIARLLPQAGTVVLTEEQKEKLYAPVNELDVEIRPDGLIYLPWMEYVSRLHAAFGLEWAIIPKGQPKMNPTKTGILWGFTLMIQGKPAGYAIGEQEYHANNPTMSWGDACEGAKSNALMRLCKGIGISLELWRPSFIREWKKKYAKQEWRTGYGGQKRQTWVKVIPDGNGSEPVSEKSEPAGTSGKASTGETPAPKPSPTEPKPNIRLTETDQMTDSFTLTAEEEAAEGEVVEDDVFATINALMNATCAKKGIPRNILENTLRAKLTSELGRKVKKIPEDLNEEEQARLINYLERLRSAK